MYHSRCLKKAGKKEMTEDTPLKWNYEVTSLYVNTSTWQTCLVSSSKYTQLYSIWKFQLHFTK